MMSENFRIRDLITIGLFNGLIRVIYFIVGISFTPFPFFYIIAAPAIVAFLNGPIFMILTAKVKYKNTFLISGIIQGTIFSLIMGLYGTLLLGGICGFVADKISKDKNSNIKNIIGYCILAIGLYLGQFLSLSLISGTDSYLFNILTPKLIGVSLTLVLLCALAGGVIGKRILNKHFFRSGVVSV